MPDPVVPGPPASVLAQISNNPGSGAAPSSALLTGNITLSGAAAGAFPYLPSLMTEIVAGPASQLWDADVTIAGNLAVGGTFTGPQFIQTTPTPVVTADYNASPGDLVICDAGATSFTVFMPEAPVNATVVGVVVAFELGGNTVTVQTQGSDVFDLAGTTQLPLDQPFQAFACQYDQAAAIWYLFASAYSPISLDENFVRAVTAPNSAITIGGNLADTTIGSVQGQLLQRTICA